MDADIGLIAVIFVGRSLIAVLFIDCILHGFIRGFVGIPIEFLSCFCFSIIRIHSFNGNIDVVVWNVGPIAVINFRVAVVILIARVVIGVVGLILTIIIVVVGRKNWFWGRPKTTIISEQAGWGCRQGVA
jgi:hypothetical protein